MELRAWTGVENDKQEGWPTLSLKPDQATPEVIKALQNLLRLYGEFLTIAPGLRVFIGATLKAKRQASEGGRNSKELTTNQNVLLLQAAYARNRNKKNAFQKTADELFKHGIESKKTKRALSGRTIKRRLRESPGVASGAVAGAGRIILLGTVS